MSAPDLETATAVLSVSLGELESLGARFALAAKAHKDALGRRDCDATREELSLVGTLLAEARDRKRGPENATLTLSNNVVNRQEAERALRSWAGQLKKALDSARSVQ